MGTRNLSVVSFQTSAKTRSPTGVRATLAAGWLFALGFALAAPSGSVLAANDPIVVDQSGGGDYIALGDALAAALPGDTVVVRPGTYTEAVAIDKDITIRGEGRREDIILEAPEAAPFPVTGHAGDDHETFAMFLEDVDARVSDLTLRGESSVVIARGGTPTLERLLVDGVGRSEATPDTGSDGSSVVVDGGSAAVIRDSTFVGGGHLAVYEGSTPRIEGNHLSDGPRIFGEFGDAAIVRGNTIERAGARPSILLWEGANALVEGNTITDAGREGIGVRRGTPTIRGNTIRRPTTDGVHVRQSDAAPLIVDNVIEDAGQTGISVADGAPRVEGNAISGAKMYGISVLRSSSSDDHPAIVGNVLRDNAAAIVWSAQAGVIDSNEVSGGAEGILIAAGSPEVTRNTITDVEGRGLFVAAVASATLDGNVSCRNGEDLVVADSPSPAVPVATDICEDLPFD